MVIQITGFDKNLPCLVILMSYGSPSYLQLKSIPPPSLLISRFRKSTTVSAKTALAVSPFFLTCKCTLSCNVCSEIFDLNIAAVPAILLSPWLSTYADRIPNLTNESARHLHTFRKLLSVVDCLNLMDSGLLEF